MQARSLRILGLPSEFLRLPLTQRRDNFAIREYEKIRMDVTHQCHKHIANVVTNHDLRIGTVHPHILSHTKRHGISFIPRAISLF